MNNLDKRILEITKVYDNNGETYDRYTVFTPDGAVYGMSEGGEGFNQYIGDYTEVEMGEHLGTKLDSVPESIKNAVLNRMVDSQFVDLFQYFELMPENVSVIFDMYYEMSGGDWDYDNLSKLQGELKELGYTFDYGLDAEPYGLRPIELSLNQLKDFEEYAKGGGINSGRDALFKSQEPHEQRYKRKREWKEYKKEGWFGDWYKDGGGVGDKIKSYRYNFDTYIDVVGTNYGGKLVLGRGKVNGIESVYLSHIDWDNDNVPENTEEIEQTVDENLNYLLNNSEKYSKGGGINSGRDAIFKSQEPHEQRYKRKREWKEYKKEGWFGDWFRDGGSMDDYTKSLGMVRVKFADPKYNYETNVSGSITEEQARNYFVGKMFDVGLYPNENMQRVIDIDFYPKGTYESGGNIGNEEEMVKSNLYNGEISCEKLTEIIGCKPNYPYQIVGAIKLEKCYLRPYYKLV